MDHKNVKILDCTLRDGGYYNSWDFDPEVVSEYLAAMAEARIDFVELGLRQFSSRKFLGAHAYTTPEYLNRLNLPVGPIYGVMVDAKTILTHGGSQEECVDELFRDAREEKISLVRVAAHFHEVVDCVPMLSRLKEKGYIVGLNIMQVSLRSEEELLSLSAEISDWDFVDIVYFADSLGSMDFSAIEKVYSSISANWVRGIGFHAHNNMGQAVSNAMRAAEIGCSWIDCTVSGMGRGAGNAETEYLLLEPSLQKPLETLNRLFGLVNRHFLKMKRALGWGVSVPYYLGALKNIHPTYIQELCADATFDSSFLPVILSELSKVDKHNAFDKHTLAKVKSNISASDDHVEGQSVPKFLDGREVLIVAQTQSGLKYQDAISDYAKKKDVALISVNYPKVVTELPYDYIAVSHNEKFLEDRDLYVKSRTPFIAPKELFLGEGINIKYDYGFSVKSGEFSNFDTFSVIPFHLTLAYVIGFCLQAGAEVINLAGFEGFDSRDPRQKEMESFLSLLTNLDLTLRSLTPTAFSIEEGSIYDI